MFDKLVTLISEKLGVEADEITMETTFEDDLQADSIALFELIMAIEDEFDIEVDDEKINGICTVGDIVNYLEELVEQ